MNGWRPWTTGSTGNWTDRARLFRDDALGAARPFRQTVHEKTGVLDGRRLFQKRGDLRWARPGRGFDNMNNKPACEIYKCTKCEAVEEDGLYQAFDRLGLLAEPS